MQAFVDAVYAPISPCVRLWPPLARDRMTRPSAFSPESPPTGGPVFLRVAELPVDFSTDDGVIKSVDGLSFELECGEVPGMAGESHPASRSPAKPSCA